MANNKKNIQNKTKKRTVLIIRNIIIIGLLLSSLLIMFGVMGINFKTSYQYARTDVLERSKNSSVDNAENIETFFLRHEDVLITAARSLEYALDKGGELSDLEDLLSGISQAYNNEVYEPTTKKKFTGIYASVNGTLIHGMRAFSELEEGYNPLERQWYKEGLAGGGQVVFGEPYQDTYDKTLMVMTATKLLKDGSTVIGMDITMDDLQTLIGDMDINAMVDGENRKYGYGFVMTENGVVMAHSEDKKQQGSDYSKLQSPMYNVFTQVKTDADNEMLFREIQIDGKAYALFSQKLSNGWFAVTLTDLQSINTTISALTSKILMITVCVALIALIYCVLTTIAYIRSDRLTGSLQNALDLAKTDALTGILNRTAYDMQVTMLRNRLETDRNEPFALIMMDLNDLKYVNDHYGHSAGDRYIINSCTLLRNIFSCEIYRIGGDEFAVFLTGDSFERWEIDYDCLKRTVNEANLNLTPNVDMPSIAVGLAIHLEGGKERMDDLLRKADTEMYTNKLAIKQARLEHSEKGITPDVKKRLIDKQLLASEMQRGMDEEQFEVWFQPQVNHASGGALIGAETLVRWNHPRRGMVSPAEFIPLFEYNGLIYELDKYVWRHACAFIREWVRAGVVPVPICKNTGWKVEYKYASWAEQLEMLENGELDIVPLAQYSAKRAEKYLYTSQSMGLLQCLILTLQVGENSIETDAITCDGKRIGILKGSRNIDLLKRYSEQMGFEYDKAEYDSQSDLEQALLNGEVDIIACEQMVKTANLCVLDRFASDPYFMITSKENTALMDELNYVMSKMNAYDPTYTSKLYQKYFGMSLSGSRPYFTSEEIECIKKHPEVTLAAIPDNEPLAYVDENGDTVGIIPDIMNRITELCGIDFRYEYVPQDITPLAFLKENPTYLGTGMLATNPAFKEENMFVSDVYYTTYAALVAHGPKREDFEYETRSYTVGVPKSFQALQLFLKENYPNLQANECLSIEDGLKALEEGKIDLFSYTLSLITPYLSNPRFGDIVVLDSRFMPCPLCTVGVNNSDNELLIGILNKCIAMIPEAEIAQLESKYFYQISYHYNDNDAFYRYRRIILLAAIVVATVIFTLLLFLWLRQRKFNRDIIIRSEYDIMTGLYNRSTMKRKVEQFLEQNGGAPCALLVFDIDNLNRINEISGHSAGDEIIKTIANIVKKQFGGSAIAGRVSGDNFAVFLTGMESKSALVTVLVRLQKMVSATVVSNVEAALSISIGVEMFRAGELVPDEAFQHANVTMHHVKSNGKDGFAFYSSQRIMPYGSIYHQLVDDVKTLAPENDEQPPLHETDEAITGSHMNCNSDFKRIVESFPNVALYVIEQKTHKVLYYNRRFKEFCPKITEGMSCRNIMVGPCHNCIVDTMGEQKMAHTIYCSDVFGDEVEITATKIIWGDGIPAVMISAWPRTILTSSNEKLPRSSNQDSFDYVTGGLTRQGFIRMMERMQSGGVDLTEYAVLFINIQDFKAVNGLVGSEGGDNLLRTMFARIEQSELHPIIGARKESDHFVFLVEKNALDLNELSRLLNFHWQYNDKELFILGRCGVFMIDDSQLEIYKMIDRAKLAKEHIVDEYVKPYSVYTPSMLEEYSESAEAFLLFDQGITNNEFIVYYQPVIDVKTEKIVGAEALVRRRTADGTIVSPGKFIPILERTGYISMLDRFVGNAVLRFQQERSDAELPIVPISFNLSQKDFYDTELMELLVNGFEKNTFPKGVILLEVTESAYTLNEKKHDGLLKRLRDAGAKILLDDFGTGYSSFGMFENYNFERLKPDMSFVRQLGKNNNVRQVVESIISMCHKLGVQVVAEGVETAEELAILREMNCDFIQGYYFSKPLPQDEFEDYLTSHI